MARTPARRKTPARPPKASKKTKEGRVTPPEDFDDEETEDEILTVNDTRSKSKDKPIHKQK